MNNMCPNYRERTIEDCIESLECLFKSYRYRDGRIDSDINYQLEVKDSPFNKLKEYTNKYKEFVDLVKRCPSELAFIADCVDYKAYLNTYKEVFQFINPKSSAAVYNEEEFNKIKDILSRDIEK